MNGVGCRGILDQFDQIIAKDNFPRRGCQITANLKFFGYGRMAAIDFLIKVVFEVLHPAHEVLTFFIHGRRDDVRVGCCEI